MPDDNLNQTEDELLSIPDKREPTYRWTVKKEKFCYHYARMGVAETAEKAAGYESVGYGSALLTQRPIRDQVQKEIRNLLRSQGENEDSVIARWARWADADIGDYFDEGWALKDISTLSETARKCIKKVKITHNAHGRNIDFELHDAAKENINLANMMGILKDTGEESESAEQQAKSIKQMLQEMNEVNGLQEPQVESRPRGKSQTTH